MKKIIINITENGAEISKEGEHIEREKEINAYAFALAAACMDEFRINWKAKALLKQAYDFSESIIDQKSAEESLKKLNLGYEK